MRSITLTRAASADAATISVTAVAALDMPVEVFRVTAADGTFSGVCTPTELSSLPTTGGDEFNRTDRTTQAFATAAVAATFWADLQAAVNLLVDSLNAADRLTGVETVELRGA